MTWQSWDAFRLNGVERNILDIFNATFGARVSGERVAPSTGCFVRRSCGRVIKSQGPISLRLASAYAHHGWFPSKTRLARL